MKGGIDAEMERQLSRAAEWAEKGKVTQNVPFLFTPKQRGKKRFLGRHGSDHVSELSYRPSSPQSLGGSAAPSDSGEDVPMETTEEAEEVD